MNLVQNTEQLKKLLKSKHKKHMRKKLYDTTLESEAEQHTRKQSTHEKKFTNRMMQKSINP